MMPQWRVSQQHDDNDGPAAKLFGFSVLAAATESQQPATAKRQKRRRREWNHHLFRARVAASLLTASCCCGHPPACAAAFSRVQSNTQQRIVGRRRQGGTREHYYCLQKQRPSLGQMGLEIVGSPTSKRRPEVPGVLRASADDDDCVGTLTRTSASAIGKRRRRASGTPAKPCYTSNDTTKWRDTINRGLPPAAASRQEPQLEPLETTEAMPRTRVFHMNDLAQEYAQIRPVACSTTFETTLVSTSNEITPNDSFLPPWLSHYRAHATEEEDIVSDGGGSSTLVTNQLQEQLECLRHDLIDKKLPLVDIEKILDTVHTVAGEDVTLELGAIDFLRLTLSVLDAAPDDLDNDYASLSSTSAAVVVTTPMLLASIVHYVDCVVARRQGTLVPQRVRQALLRLQEGTVWKERRRPRPKNERRATWDVPRCLPAKTEAEACTTISTMNVTIAAADGASSELKSGRCSVEVLNSSSDPTTRGKMVVMSKIAEDRPKATTMTASAASIPDEEVLLIAEGAARLKQAEVVAQAVLGENLSATHRRLPKGRADRLRDFYLSLTDDWRSLAIRVVASLYRIERGSLLLESDQGNDEPEPVATGEAVVEESVPNLSKEEKQEVRSAAREGLQVYATLAQRLGMHRLKSKIEERAFRILYRRQYGAVSTLYEHELKGQDTMQSIANFLLADIKELLLGDEVLMSQLEDVQVTARVKEPFSFWKKLLKKRVSAHKQLQSSQSDGRTRSSVNDTNPAASSDGASLSRHQSSLSMIAEINDGIALRVILKARQQATEEREAAATDRLDREAFLCFYAHYLIRLHWPETDPDRIKDYISNPKRNGYRSLHHTAQISSPEHGVFGFPFEVQVRSEEMHRFAEHGVAAHWTYKLGSRDGESNGSRLSGKATLDNAQQSDKKALFVQKNAQHDNSSQEEPSSSSSMSATAGSYQAALTTAQQDIQKRQVFAFVMNAAPSNSGNDSSKGELLLLSINSSIRDAVGYLDPTAEGASLPGNAKVWRNGRLTNLDDPVPLKNGEFLVFSL